MPSVLILAAGDPGDAPAGPLAEGLRAADSGVQVTVEGAGGPALELPGPVAAPARAVASRSRARRLPALVTLTGARAVASDDPATIAALGRLRRRGELAVPAVALVTRIADPRAQAADGVDLHLLADPGMRHAVREAAPASRIACVRGLLDPRYEGEAEVAAARRAVGVPEASPLVVVFGGQEASGDLAGAGEVALAADPAARVVILCGRNEERRSQLAQWFARAGRLRVVGLTDRLPDLLAAADVLVDTARGLTAVEARLRGAAVIAYGRDEVAGRQALADALIAALREPRAGADGYADRPSAADELLAVAGLAPAPA